MSDCNMLCGGDDTQYCGDGNRLELYSTTSAPATTTTAPPSTPTHVEAVGDYALAGCWTEIPDGRALSQRSRHGADMTNEVCADVCSGFRYFATQYSRECYCGSHVSTLSSPADLGDCGMPCAGDPGSYCGGRSRLQVYINPDIPGGARALRGRATSRVDMTNEACAAFCDGLAYFGTQYGAECYCGATLPEEAGEVDVKDCDMLCSGSVLEFCGAGNRLSVYKRKDEEIIEVV